MGMRAGWVAGTVAVVGLLAWGVLTPTLAQVTVCSSTVDLSVDLDRIIYGAGDGRCVDMFVDYRIEYGFGSDNLCNIFIDYEVYTKNKMLGCGVIYKCNFIHKVFDVYKEDIDSRILSGDCSEEQNGG